jgi:hypothetical protein
VDRVGVGILLALAVCGCRQLAGLDDPLAGDAGGLPDGDVDSPPATATCYGTGGLLEVCLDDRGRGDVTLPAQIDTDSSMLCATNVTSGGTAFCVIAADRLTVATGSTTSGFGSNPLVLIAHDTITIDGTLDVASHRAGFNNRGAGANFSGCNNATNPPSSGGGAGGSFGALGGVGGTPGTNNPGAVLAAPTTLHGGCAGEDGGGSEAGNGGDGGGAVHLIAGSTIDVSGTINASGAGSDDGEDGSTGGGGGGGSGGMIGLDAQAVSIAGTVFANGGGGSEGNATQKGQVGGDPQNGGVGTGGNGASTGGIGGNGGAGGIAATAGGAGTAGTAGGGGGGGGVGVIKVFGSQSGAGLISPPPS